MRTSRFRPRGTLALGLGIAALTLFYLWPGPRHTFAELADRVDPPVRRSLLDFRAQHPPQHLTVGRATWEYVALGQGPETIVFLHGMTGAYDIWWQQMLALAPHYRVISVTYPPVETLEGLAQGVLAVMDAEGVARAHFVGTSLGGYLAQYLMAAHPDRLQGKVVLGNTFPPNELQRQKNGRLIRVLPWLPEWLIMRILRGSFRERIYPAAGYSELVLAYMLEQTDGRMSKAQVVARARALLEPFPPADLTALGLRVMIIEADNDPLVEPELRTLLKATYPSAEVHTLSGVGHFPYLNAAEDYTALLEAFFGQR